MRSKHSKPLSVSKEKCKGNAFPLSSIKNCFAKIYQKFLLSSLKATTNLLSLKICGIQGIYFIILAFLIMNSSTWGSHWDLVNWFIRLPAFPALNNFRVCRNNVEGAVSRVTVNRVDLKKKTQACCVRKETTSDDALIH